MKSAIRRGQLRDARAPAGAQEPPADGRAWEEDDCVRRVIRSGSWYGKPRYVRSANRFWYAAHFRNNNLGFRLARTLQD